MKLEQLKISPSPLTDRIYVGTVSAKDPGTWSSKMDFTREFLAALMLWCPVGTYREIKDNQGNLYRLRVERVQDDKQGEKG